MTPPDQNLRRIVVVTGPSGAGRSTTLNVLEDAGYEVIDNLPLRLMPVLLDDPDQSRPLALGIDARNRDFSTNTVIDFLGRLALKPGVLAELLFLDCSTEVLLHRFSETRRRHPMAPANRPAEGIGAEQELLMPLRVRADMLIDTSTLNVHELRAEVEHWFAPGGKRHLSVAVQSFSYKRGLPRSVDMVYDCRFLKNPYWEPSLRALNGTDPRVAAHVATDPRYDEFSQKVLDMSRLILPACREEGKSHFSIAFGCTGGQHRSVTLAESHASQLADEGWQVSIRHREINARQQEGMQKT
ncbi:RNase adapter RapZ [Sulfitobacter sp. F26169L]|uniref:RNase adapter RapZ n=1 Tax=Sulfitobacter sp. F26169L TaxID=2996015 RepID=UPI003A4C5FDF